MCEATSKLLGDTVSELIEFRDPAIFQWHFFLQSHDIEDPATAELHWRSFVDALRLAWEWLNSGTMQAFPKPKDPSSSARNRSVSRRIACAGPVLHQDAERELDARALSDAFYIQLAQVWQGDFDSRHFAQHRAVMMTESGFAPSGHSYLGSNTALWLEIEPAREDGVAELIDELAGLWLGVDVSVDGCVEIPCGWLAMSSQGESEIVIVVARANDSSKPHIDHLHSKAMRSP